MNLNIEFADIDDKNIQTDIIVGTNEVKDMMLEILHQRNCKDPGRRELAIGSPQI